MEIKRVKLKVEDYPEIEPEWIRLINKVRFKLRFAEVTLVTYDGTVKRVKEGVNQDDLSHDYD